MSVPGAEQLKARTGRLAASLQQRGVDALVVDSLFDVGYLAGYTGSNGLALVIAPSAAERLGAHRFFTDSRYATQAGEQVPDLYRREIVNGDLLAKAGELLAGGKEGAGAGAVTGSGAGRLGFDDTHLTVKAHARLAEVLGEGWEPVACSGAVAALRAVKEAGEVALLRAACALADEALGQVLEGGLVGRTERDVAVDLEVSMRRLGAAGVSFSPIVASGAHGALPHAAPREVAIERDVLVTIDWGCVLDGYCSDCTRTYATGEHISTRAGEVYALVLEAQLAGLAAVSAGRSGREIDTVARDLIERAGEGEHFGHGLGHGVGREIHEAPRLARTAPEDPLVAGNVVSVEPGVYLPGELGVRIEDLVVVGDSAEAQEVLTSLPKELTVVS